MHAADEFCLRMRGDMKNQTAHSRNESASVEKRLQFAELMREAEYSVCAGCFRCEGFTVSSHGRKRLAICRVTDTDLVLRPALSGRTKVVCSKYISRKKKLDEIAIHGTERKLKQ